MHTLPTVLQIREVRYMILTGLDDVSGIARRTSLPTRDVFQIAKAMRTPQTKSDVKAKRRRLEEFFRTLNVNTE